MYLDYPPTRLSYKKLFFLFRVSVAVGDKKLSHSLILPLMIRRLYFYILD